MSRYIQTGRVEDGKLEYTYMGAAEFEYGSVQRTRQLLRFGPTRSAILDEVYYKDPGEKSDAVEKLVIIAINHDLPNGNTFKRAVENFHACIRRSYDRQSFRTFKEPTRLEYSVGILGSADYKPNPGPHRSKFWDMHFWMSVDFGVHYRRSVDAFNEDDANTALERYYSLLSDDRSDPPVWVVCRLKDFKAVTESMSFPKLIAPGVEAIDTSALRLFDKIVYRTQTGELTGKVVGILEKGIRIERNGERAVIPESSIVRIVA